MPNEGKGLRTIFGPEPFYPVRDLFHSEPRAVPEVSGQDLEKIRDENHKTDKEKKGGKQNAARQDKIPEERIISVRGGKSPRGHDFGKDEKGEAGKREEQQDGAAALSVRVEFMSAERAEKEQEYQRGSAFFGERPARNMRPARDAGRPRAGYIPGSPYFFRSFCKTSRLSEAVLRSISPVFLLFFLLYRPAGGVKRN